MNKNIFKIAILIFFVQVGCSKSFLEIPPQNNISSDVFLVTDDDVMKATEGLYDRMQTLYSSCWNGMHFIQNVISDDAQSAGPNAFDTPEYEALDVFDWETNNSKILGLWSRLFEIVSSSNAIIEKVSANTEATDGMKQMVGEAKAIRAFAYMELVKMFGAVPFFTENPTSTDQYNKPRTSVADIYKQIEIDLNDAIKIVPLKSAYSSANKYRFSKGTAQFLLGKALLYEKKYAESAVVLGQLIASNEYDLLDNYMDNFLQPSEFGMESVFETSYVSTLGSTWGSQNGAFDGRTNEVNIQLQLEGPRTDNGFFTIPDNYAGTAANYDVGIRGGWGFNLPSNKVSALLQSDPNDTRSKSVLSDADFKARGGSVQASPTPFRYEGYLRLKYACRNSETDITAVPELNYGTNIRVMRYSDALLMAAEAYHMNNEDGKAIIELNKVRNRAGLVSVDLTGTALFNQIVIERQKEFAFEGIRFYDLVRWGTAVTELGSLGFEANHHELFPIPDTEITSNTAISSADQNPGYN